MKDAFVQRVGFKLDQETARLSDLARAQAYEGIEDLAQMAQATRTLQEMHAVDAVVQQVRALGAAMEDTDLFAAGERLVNRLDAAASVQLEKAKGLALLAADPRAEPAERAQKLEEARAARLEEAALRLAVVMATQVQAEYMPRAVAA